MTRARWFLAAAGVVAAVALGLAANEISGDSIGLSAKPLQPGDSLAPAQRERTPRRAERQRTTETGTNTTTTPSAPAPEDDRGGEAGSDDNSGSGSSGSDDNSGSGSSGSGKGRSGGDDDD